MKKIEKGTAMWKRLCAAAAGLMVAAMLMPQSTMISKAAEPLTVTGTEDVAIIIGGGQNDSVNTGTGNEGGAENAEQQPEVNLLEENKAAGSGTVISVKVIKESVNVRSAASTGSEKAGSVKRNDILKVTGQETDSEGKTWYAVTFQKDGSEANGYVRSDMVEVNETASAETTPEENTEEVPAEPEVPVNNDFTVALEDDGTGTGTSVWYLYDNVSGGKFEISTLLSAPGEEGGSEETENASGMKTVVIILAVVVVLLIIVVSVLIFKIRGDEYDDEYDDDEDDDDDDDDEEDYPRRGRKHIGPVGRVGVIDDDDDDDDDDDEEDYPRRGRKPVRKPAVRSRYEEDDDDEDDDVEEYVPVRKTRRDSEEPKKTEKASVKEKDWQSKNFLDEEDMDFEFLDFK